MWGERADDMYLLENHSPLACITSSLVCTCTYSPTPLSLIKTRDYSQSNLLRVLPETLHTSHKIQYLKGEFFIYLAKGMGIWFELTALYIIEIAGVYADAWRSACTLKLSMWWNGLVISLPLWSDTLPLGASLLVLTQSQPTVWQSNLSQDLPLLILG